MIGDIGRLGNGLRFAAVKEFVVHVPAAGAGQVESPHVAVDVASPRDIHVAIAIGVEQRWRRKPIGITRVPASGADQGYIPGFELDQHQFSDTIGAADAVAVDGIPFAIV